MIVSAWLSEFWGRVAKSWTMVSMFLCYLATVALDNFDSISTVLLDPQVSDQIKQFIGGDTKAIAFWTRLVITVAMATRVKGLLKK